MGQAESPRRVLAVDDAADVADSFALLLQGMDAKVRVARSGAQSLAICAEFAPELAFLDIGMLVMDGFEIARRIREPPTGKHATLIALTGWSEDGTGWRATEAGFDRHVTKPADLRDIEAILSAAP